LLAPLEAAPMGLGRFDDLRFVAFTVREWRTVLRFSFVRVIGSLLRFARRHPPHHLSPARANNPAGLGSKEHFNGSHSHSNAPFAAHYQFIRSKIIAFWAARGHLTVGLSCREQTFDRHVGGQHGRRY
jgi:hypothetical protein